LESRQNRWYTYIHPNIWNKLVLTQETQAGTYSTEISLLRSLLASQQLVCIFPQAQIYAEVLLKLSKIYISLNTCGFSTRPISLYDVCSRNETFQCQRAPPDFRKCQFSQSTIGELEHLPAPKGNFTPGLECYQKCLNWVKECELLLNGPLASKRKAVKAYYVIIWAGKTERTHNKSLNRSTEQEGDTSVLLKT